MNNTETTESVSPTEVAGISIPITSALIPGIKIPQQFPTKFIRSNSDLHNEPNTSEMITTQDKFSDSTSLQFQFQSTAKLPFSQFQRSQGNRPLYKKLTE